MVQYSQTPPTVRGPNKEWSIKFVKSLSGMLKIAEMVRKELAIVLVVYIKEVGRGLTGT